MASNLSEALINAKKLEQNFLKREFTFLDRERNKIRANLDRHMETFLQMTRKRHETWYRHDKHFREALRKEKESHEKRKERNRQKLLYTSNVDYIPRIQTPFQALLTESVILPPIATTIPRDDTITISQNPISSPTIIDSINNNSSSITTIPPIQNNTSSAIISRPEPMTKVERRTFQVLRASQKLLDESAARSRYKFVMERPSSTKVKHKNLPPGSVSSSCSFNSATLVPMATIIDCEEYDRLINESLQHETFGEFVDHVVKFRPEFREQFGLTYEATKRQKAIEKLREYNQIHAKTKDERYHKLISSLSDLRSEEKEKNH